MSPYRFAGRLLSGITELKDKYKGESAIICCSGITFKEYDNSIAPPSWPRFAVNEAIRGLGKEADFWVLSDHPIVHEYGALCPINVSVLAMHQATTIITKHCRAHTIYTVNSMRDIKEYNNGYEFYSRGTVMIGAVEMARYMGIKRFFVFGCDCYRTKEAYYYDGRKPIPLSEKNLAPSKRVRDITNNPNLFVTDRLRNMIVKLNKVAKSSLWEGIEIFCVNSPDSQQKAMPKMTLGEFKYLVMQETQQAKPKQKRRGRGRPKKTSYITTSNSSSSSTTSSSKTTTAPENAQSIHAVDEQTFIDSTPSTTYIAP